jgi:hypothetical protein
MTAARAHGKYILISRPHYDEKMGAWVPYAACFADEIPDDENFYYRRFNDLNSTFQTEEQALSFGFIVARAWVDEHLSFTLLTPGRERASSRKKKTRH